MTVTNEETELVHGSGNVFRDLGLPNAEARQLKAILAGQVLKALDERGLSTRQAQALTGVDHSDYVRVRRAQLGRFTVDRLMAMLEGLGHTVEVSVSVRPRDLELASGAGEHGRHSVGTTVFGGMIISTILNLFFIPVLYLIIEGWRERGKSTAT